MGVWKLWEYSQYKLSFSKLWMKNPPPLLRLSPAPYAKCYLHLVPQNPCFPHSYKPFRFPVFTLSNKSNVLHAANHQLTLLFPPAIIYGYLWVSLPNPKIWGITPIFFIPTHPSFLTFLLQPIFHPQYSIKGVSWKVIYQFCLVTTNGPFVQFNS